MDGFGGFGLTGPLAYVEGSGRISGRGTTSGNVLGRTIHVTGRVTSEADPARSENVAAGITVTGTTSFTTMLSGGGSVRGYAGGLMTNLTGRGHVRGSGPGRVEVRGTGSVTTSVMGPNERWRGTMSGFDRVSGTGTTSGDVSGNFLVRGMRMTGTQYGYGYGGALYTYPRYTYTGGTAEVYGTASVSTEFTGFARVRGEARGEGPTGSVTVSGSTPVWASGYGSVNLVSTQVNLRV